MISETEEKMIRCMAELKFADPKQKKTKTLKVIYYLSFPLPSKFMSLSLGASNIADFLENKTVSALRSSDQTTNLLQVLHRKAAICTVKERDREKSLQTFP